MSVLAKLGIDWRLLIAQAVNFLILLLVLRRFAYRPMLEFLEKRTKKIESGLRDAKRAAEKLSEIEAKEREVLDEARKESAAIVAHARELAEKTADKIMIESRKESERILGETRKKIEAEQESMCTDMKRELVGLVMLATEKVLDEKLKDMNDDELIRQAVEKL